MRGFQCVKISTNDDGHINVIVMVELLDNVLLLDAKGIRDLFGIGPVSYTIDDKRFCDIGCLVVVHLDDVKASCAKIRGAAIRGTLKTGSIEHIDLDDFPGSDARPSCIDRRLKNVSVQKRIGEIPDNDRKQADEEVKSKDTGIFTRGNDGGWRTVFVHEKS